MTDEIGDDLKFGKIQQREWGAAKWVRGTIAGHRFDALVFPEHAQDASYELGDSKISKLWIQRIADKTTTFNFDRGMDADATDDATRAIVAFLCAGLADYVFHK
jgi:hypothetical protein